jgi:hypothetical protein
MGFIQNLFSGGASQVIDSVGNVLDKVVTTKSEKLQLELELKKADHQFEIDVKNLDLEDKKAILGDIDSARKRDSDVQASANASTLAKNVSPVLALGGVFLTFSLFALLMFGTWNPEDTNKKEIVLYVFGVLSGILTQVFSYYFGSSLGSKAKTDIIQNMNENLIAK